MTDRNAVLTLWVWPEHFSASAQTQFLFRNRFLDSNNLVIVLVVNNCAKFSKLYFQSFNLIILVTAGGGFGMSIKITYSSDGASDLVGMVE